MKRSKRMAQLFSTFCKSNFISPVSVRSVKTSDQTTGGGEGRFKTVMSVNKSLTLSLMIFFELLRQSCTGVIFSIDIEIYRVEKYSGISPLSSCSLLLFSPSSPHNSLCILCAGLTVCTDVRIFFRKFAKMYGIRT